MAYKYKMIQVPPTIYVQASREHGGEAAAYLEKVVNTQAQEGWEFYRVDQIGVLTTPGCIARLLGQRSSLDYYYVVTFRREVER